MRSAILAATSTNVGYLRLLSFTDVSLRRGTRELISGMTVTINRRQKVGITGANGVGKSTLLAMVRGELQADTGDFQMPANTVMAHVAQETPAVDTTALEYVVEGDTELRQTEQDLADAVAAGDGLKQATLHEKLAAIDGYAARSRAGRLLHGLGFNPEHLDMPVRSFSGGWRMRLNLAQALMCRSDLLLLDEPTNHLDLDAVIWVEQWLNAYAGTLLLISHDRDFLDRVVTHIGHIEQSGMTMYTGNYSEFEKLRAERLANQSAAYSKQQREIAHVRSFVDRFKAKATKAKQAQSRLKMLERMELINPAHVDSEFDFEFRVPEKLPDPLVRLDEVDAGYGDVRILDKISLSIQPGDRFGLLGRNGAGKSTLIRSIAGELKPQNGAREIAKDLRVGYFAQHQLEQLNPDGSPVDHLRKIDRRVSDKEARAFLGGFGFQGEMALSPSAPFSGGEKARLVLALLVYQKPNLLLLDEPTNHLDLGMRHALTRALQDFDGAMVVVSHDRHLLESVSDRLYLVSEGKVDEFSDDLEAYRRWLLAERKEEKSDSADKGAPVKDNSREAKKERRQADADRRKQLQTVRNRVKKLERQLESLSSDKKSIEEQLADQTLYEDDNWEKLKPLLEKQTGIETRLTQVESDWLEATEELEQAEN